MDFSFPLKTLHLNQEQSHAVLRDPHVHQRILASAGSGKTTTLTARIAYLIQHYHMKPESIVLMTFSRNAAKQMVERIESLIGPTNLWAGTFHGLSKTILQKHDSSRLGTLYFVDELIGMATSWLTTPKGRVWVGKLRYIVVDEFQDINAAQWKMVERMLHPGARLLVVGDDAQNIYTWRGSNVGFILDLGKKVLGLVDDQLRTNYRSSESIISVANAVMRFIPTLPWKKSMLGSGRLIGKKPDIHFFWHMKDETRWILNTIRNIQKQNPSLTIAILSRTNLDLFRFEEELLNESIPYRLCDVAEDSAENSPRINNVDLVTLHASKGLEWDIVFVIHCNDEVFPSSKRKEDIICERRLFYVACTRARKHLFLTYTRNERDLSRFIREVPTRYLTYHGLARYCLSEAELNEGVPNLDSLLSALDGDDFKDLRDSGYLQWLDLRTIHQENLFPPGESWILPVWARRLDISRDFLRFLRTLVKRIVVQKQKGGIPYRDPLAERLLFTLRIFSEDRLFWEKWHDELLAFIYMKFRGDEAARVPPPIDYACMNEWSKEQNLFWTPQEILSATSLIAKIRGQLRPLRFETYDLHEFTIAPARFVVPTESRGEILRSWRQVVNLDLENRGILEDIWRISTLELVAEGRNAPLYRVSQMRKSFEDQEFLDFVYTLETFIDIWIEKEKNDIQVGLEIESEWVQPETVDIFMKGTFWRIGGEEKERISSMKLLALAITAGFAQQQGIEVDSVGILYPLDGRCIQVPLPKNWKNIFEMILVRAKKGVL